MNSNKGASDLEDGKVNVKLKISALWIAMMLVYIYADILSLFRPGQISEMMGGKMGPLQATQANLFSAAILMAIPAAMVFLSLALKAKANRWANIVLGVLYIAVNIGNIIGENWAYYIMFVILELVFASLIVRYAWKWPKQEN